MPKGEGMVFVCLRKVEMERSEGVEEVDVYRDFRMVRVGGGLLCVEMKGEKREIDAVGFWGDLLLDLERRGEDGHNYALEFHWY